MSDTVTLVSREVRRLLEATPAYRGLPAEEQEKLAGDIVRISIYLAEPEGIRANELTGAVVAVPPETVAGRNLLAAVNFPTFVGALIDGVFQSIVDSSIEQMRAYSDLVSGLAKTVERYASDITSDAAAREWLARTYADCFERDERTGKRLWCKLILVMRWAGFAELRVCKGSQAASAAFHSSAIVALRFPNLPVLN